MLDPVTGELNLTDQQICEFREAFHLFDKDGDGHITADELMVVLQSLGQSPTREQVDEMISEVDLDGNGEMEFEEFVKLMLKNMGPKEDEAALREAFRLLDKDGSGGISREEMWDVLVSFKGVSGELVDKSDLNAMIAEADVDGDGTISFDEFTKVLMKDAD